MSDIPVRVMTTHGGQGTALFMDKEAGEAVRKLVDNPWNCTGMNWKDKSALNRVMLAFNAWKRELPGEAQRSIDRSMAADEAVF